ncbi:MAG: membrane protein insertase YidC [Alphaproteobacteria bacterium]|nr:MAG: membrane protein insertase YidC [Alphaproteobacteria bacterium]
MDDQNKNLILATALSFLVILVWFVLFPPEPPATTPPEAPAPAESTAELAPVPTTVAETPAQAASPAAPAASVAPAADESARVAIDTPRIKGSILLKGGRIDDILLKDYREELSEDSPLVRLLTPVGRDHAYYALHGWIPGGGLDVAAVPGPNTPWRIESGDTLAPGKPVTLVWDNGQGLVFRKTFAVDDNYMFTVTQSVQNAGAEARTLAPYGLIARHGKPGGRAFFILHEGVVMEADGTLEEIKYKNMDDLDLVERERARAEIVPVEENGWIGFTDKYWMSTLVPMPGQPFTAVAKYVESADIYQTETRLPAVTLNPGETREAKTLLFAGAKEWETIRGYEESLGILHFEDSIDWGWFFFLTKPIFRALHFLHGVIGNMGWSIILLTLVIKALVFPLAYRSYVSMAKMKELQPELQRLKERAGDDRQKLQREMMELYKREKVNPAAGCLPILLQIPIFFSLYKVIFVTIELRHAPWILWIRDLSAPDPTSILNLFGLLPWAAPAPDSFLSIFSLGVLPILLGISMWLQQKLNPAPTDAVQAQVFAWMPWIFMFMLGQFPSGLVLYWITNNMLTFAQQYTIMRIHGHKPDVLGNILGPIRRRREERADRK